MTGWVGEKEVEVVVDWLLPMIVVVDVDSLKNDAWHHHPIR